MNEITRQWTLATQSSSKLPGGVFGDEQNMTKHGDNRVTGAAKIGTLDISTSGFSQSTCCDPPRPSSADDLRLQKLSSTLFHRWKTELRQFKILRQHLINYLAHARCLCSLPQHFVFVCFAASHHLSVCHRTFQLYKHQQVDYNGFSLGHLTHLQQRRTKCAMRSILWNT